MSLSAVSKAIAGAIITALVGYIAKYGVTLDPQAVEAISVLLTLGISAVAGYVTVYLAPKNK